MGIDVTHHIFQPGKPDQPACWLMLLMGRLFEIQHDVQTWPLRGGFIPHAQKNEFMNEYKYTPQVCPALHVAEECSYAI